MKKFNSKMIVFFLISLLLAGCTPTEETVKKETPPPPPAIEKKPVGPDITLIVASIDLSTLSKRIEKKDIESFAATLKKEKVDILAVQGINRYPGVTTRIDVFDEIADGMEMRKAFGETMTLSGRQSGNAIFSTYPIRSNNNQHYSGISSTNFESALHAVIDGGARDIVIISTLVPAGASENELSKCVSTLISLQQSYSGTPTIVMGNLPKPPRPEIRKEFNTSIEPFEAVNYVLTIGNSRYTIWHTSDGLKPISSRTITTSLGSVITTQFGLYRKPEP